ncbi:LysR family transcriptional regulator [Paeniglutamicibacter cryotolerans]|uniref:DNA-binding transcriptional LysR family regulator n=1 Tax=Paeniglutamicibacter cryotolerans TaxID=670079 RepID=A0A839QUT0_9MICC|nr:LysR family transcriptional regulator [Paeniglutamicibacter cryotolerans]MBB2995761.1 DNA-binding transcriptional LysR family regulator [Paeniglutamicibacter cryotolerans]
MELKHVSAFLMVAEELHFGRAASRLRIAQPQLSQWIKRLEDDLGAPLFDRSTRTVALTPQGAAILIPAREMLSQARQVELGARLEGPGIIGRVRVGYAGASSREVLPPIARVLRTREPGIELSLESMIYAGFTPGMIAAGELDIGFSRLPLKHPGVESRVFTYERILVAMPADHPLAKRKEIKLADLAAEPWVMFPATRGSTVRDAGIRLAREAGFIPRIAQEAPDSYAILGLVAAGVGVTLTVSSVQHISTSGLVYRELAGEQRYLAAVIAWHTHPNPATGRLLEIMEEILPTPAHPEGRVLT